MAVVALSSAGGVALASRAAHRALQVARCATARVFLGLWRRGRFGGGGCCGSAGALLDRSRTTAVPHSTTSSRLGASFRRVVRGGRSGRRRRRGRFGRRRRSWGGRGRGCGGYDGRGRGCRWRRTQHEDDRHGSNRNDQRRAHDVQAGLALGLRGTVVASLRAPEPTPERRRDAERRRRERRDERRGR